MKNKTFLEKDTFIVRDGETYIIYAPFRGLITRINEFPKKNSLFYYQLIDVGFFREPPKSIKRDVEWRDFRSLTLLLTRACNMSCIYCYAKATSNGERMPLKIALGTVEWFLKQFIGETIRITFHGGGEPTLEIKTIKRVVEYIERHKRDKKTTYLITTNGTAKREIWDWLVNYQFGISISMDGPPDIQNRNRPLAVLGQKNSSQIVERNLKFLITREYPFSVRLTFSPTDDITRIVKYFGELGVKTLHLEPLFPYGREYKSVEFGGKSRYKIYSPQGEELLKNFWQALEMARKYGMKIRNGHISYFTKGIGYFCGAASARSMIVNHEGKLTGCLEVVDSLDLDANIFNFGYYVPEEKRFEIDFSKVKIMQERHADALSGCNLCYARYTCAGGCAVKAVRESNNFFARDLLYCAFTKNLIPLLVKHIANTTGI